MTITETSVAWVAVNRPGEPNRYELGLGRAGKVVLVEKDPHRWLAGHQAPDGTKRVIIDWATLDEAQEAGEGYARRVGAAALVDADTRWRTRRATAKQRAACAKFDIDLPPSATKGEAADMLTAHIARLEAKRRGRP